MESTVSWAKEVGEEITYLNGITEVIARVTTRATWKDVDKLRWCPCLDNQGVDIDTYRCDCCFGICAILLKNDTGDERGQYLCMYCVFGDHISIHLKHKVNSCKMCRDNKKYDEHEGKWKVVKKKKERVRKDSGSDDEWKKKKEWKRIVKTENPKFQKKTFSEVTKGEKPICDNVRTLVEAKVNEIKTDFQVLLNGKVDEINKIKKEREEERVKYENKISSLEARNHNLSEEIRLRTLVMEASGINFEEEKKKLEDAAAEQNKKLEEEAAELEKEKMRIQEELAAKVKELELKKHQVNIKKVVVAQFKKAEKVKPKEIEVEKKEEIKLSVTAERIIDEAISVQKSMDNEQEEQEILDSLISGSLYNRMVQDLKEDDYKEFGKFKNKSAFLFFAIKKGWIVNAGDVKNLSKLFPRLLTDREKSLLFNEKEEEHLEDWGSKVEIEDECEEDLFEDAGDDLDFSQMKEGVERKIKLSSYEFDEWGYTPSNADFY